VTALVSYARPLAWRLVEQGLRHIGGRRDRVWARRAYEEAQRREAEDQENPGSPLDSPLQREIAVIALREGSSPLEDPFIALALVSRKEALQYGSAQTLAFQAGDLRGALPLWSERTERALARGEFALAVRQLAYIARLHAALGELEAAQECTECASRLAGRLSEGSYAYFNLAAARADLALVRGAGLEPLLSLGESFLARAAPDQAYGRADLWAYMAYGYAWAGRVGPALEALPHVVPAVERAPGWANNYTRVIHLAVETLWLLERFNHLDLLEHNLREKTLAPDFRYPHADARLSLARICALQGRHDEAVEWFAKAREVLEEQGARPLRAITHYDEALMYVRRNAPGDRDRAAPLREQALAGFRGIGMPGWQQRALDHLGSGR